MDITQNRRDRLKAWFANRTLPEKEKSYLSQLIGGKASFGEKAARRLEQTYGMPEGHLDRSDEATAEPRPAPTDTTELLDAWAWLLPSQKQDVIDTIKPLSSHNRQAVEQLAPKDVVHRTVRVSDRRKSAGILPFGMEERRKKNESA